LDAAAVATPVADGLRLAVRLTPRSSADRILGIARDDAGRAMLKVAVTAVPEDGRANAALVKLLARTLDLPRTTVSVVSGHTARAKLVHLAGDPPDLLARLSRTIEGLS